jgi:beta-N-acetylhexosaminidase
VVGRPDAPVLIDQEGGRVRRLKPPHWYDAPPGAVFGNLAKAAETTAVEAARLNARLIAADLADLGIDVDCAPVLDVPAPGSHDIVGDRAYSADPEWVVRLGRATHEGLLDGGVLPIIKHIPGHGRAFADSHLELPVVNASLEELRAFDFVPFRALADAPWAMTAHIVYQAIDPERPATWSPRLIDSIIRGEIGFDGVLVSDDVSMKALTGRFEDRTRAALDAGCDVVLHCNGDMAEMSAVLSAAPPLTDAAQTRLARAAARKRAVPPPDRVAATKWLQGWLNG